MNGNRGAKGSIKDRLISMLYRFRYKKKKLKEKDYTIQNKQKQVNYLNNLKEFKETENLNILEKKDINALENVKFQARIKVGINEKEKQVIKENTKIELNEIKEPLTIGLNEEKKVEKTTTTNLKKENTNSIDKVSKKESINTIITTTKQEKTFIPNKVAIADPYEQLDIKLKDIESKTNELNHPVNIKKEIRKTNDEIVIIKEVNKFIMKSKEEIDEIKKDVVVIKEDIKNKNTDSKELEEKYDKLKKKIEKLKAKYDAIKNRYDFSEFYLFESIKLIDSVDDYKSISNLNEMDMMLNICKNELEKIDSIVILDQDKKELGSSLEDKKENEKNIKIKFVKSKEKANNISDIEQTIYKELQVQEQVINEMYKEASYIKKEVSRQIEKIGHKKILSSMLNISFGILTLPFTGKNLFGIALGETMINKGLKEMNRRLETREKITVNYKYKDISDSIRSVKDKVEYINLVISDSLNEIKKLKENFKNQYCEYDNLLEEYDIVLEKILKIEGTLLNEQNHLNSMNKKLNEENEMNKQKLKKVEDYKR